MKESKIRELLLEYQIKRDLAEKRLEYRKNKTYQQIPQLEKIDDKISKVGLEMTHNVLFSNSKDKSKLLEESRIKIEQLKMEKEEIIKHYNIPKNHIEIEYECNKCNDTGFFINTNEKCVCFKQRIINEAYKMSNITQINKFTDIDDLNLELFSKDIDDKEGISPFENMALISDDCSKFINSFHKDNNYNLLFYGDTGLGKTFISNCMAKSLLDKGYTVVYQTAFKIFEIIEKYKFNRENRTEFDTLLYENIFECDLLIIDDLGTESLNSFTHGELFNIINTRLLNNKKMIISTNLTPYLLSEVYADRIFSRISDSFKILKFFGKDLRWENQKDALSR